MKPLTLRLKAFASYKEETFLDFASIGEENFFLIHGNTGAGKTSILDAIVYALYGGDGTMGGRSNLIMRNAEAAPDDLTDVDFHFALKGERYRVHRTITQKRKRDGSINPTPTHSAALYKYVDGEERLIDGRNTTTVTQAVTSLLGLGATEFRQVVLLPQGAFREFLLAEPKDRRELFSKIFQTQRFRRLAEKLQAKAKEGAAAQEKCAERRKTLLQQTTCETFDDFLRSIRTLKEESRRMQEAIAPLKAESASAQKAYEQGLENARKRAQLAEAKAQLQRAAETRDRCTGERERLAAAKRAAALEETKAQLDATQNKSDDLRREQEANAKTIADLAISQKEAQSATDAAADKVQRLETLREERRILAEQQKHLDNFRQKQAELEEKEKRAEAARKEADRAASAVPALRAEQEQTHRIWQEAIERSGQLEGLEHTLSDLQKKEAIAQEGKTVKSQIDGLTAQLHTATEKLRIATEQAAALAKAAEDIADARILGQAHELASRLQDGSPCPVCGSTHHPAPQLSAADIPSEAAVKAARRSAQQAETARQKLDAAVLSLQKDCESKTARRNELASEWDALPKTAKTKEELMRTIDEARRAKETAPKHKARHEELSKTILAAEATAKEKGALCQKCSEDAQAAHGALSEVRKLLPQGASPETLEAKSVRIETEIASITTEIERAKETWERVQKDALRAKATGEALAKQAETASAELARLAAKFRERLSDTGFPSAEAWANALTGDYASETGRNAVEERLQAVDRAYTAAEGALKVAEAAAAGVEAPDVEALQSAAEAALDAWNRASTAHSLKAKEIEDKKKLQSDIEKILAQEKALDSEYGMLTRLAEVANGRVDGGQKKTRMDLETYVLRLLLGDVIEAANHRLIRISQGQYLLDPPNMEEIDSQSGLNFTVFDEDAGTSRSLASLSGGESFIVALSLSLGLSDTIVYYANSRPLETLFIDEGFGSLDGDRLDIAIKALLDLRDTGRLVGIISHVEELKNTIDIRLEVTKSTSTGSHARFVTNG